MSSIVLMGHARRGSRRLERRPHSAPLPRLSKQIITAGCEPRDPQDSWRVRRQLWVKGGRAEQVAAAAGSPQKAALLAAVRNFGLGPITDITGSDQNLFAAQEKPARDVLRSGVIRRTAARRAILASALALVDVWHGSECVSIKDMDRLVRC